MDKDYFTVWLTQGSQWHVQELAFEEGIEIMGFLKFAGHGFYHQGLDLE